jgi:hypothetical protein
MMLSWQAGRQAGVGAAGSDARLPPPPPGRCTTPFPPLLMPWQCPHPGIDTPTAYFLLASSPLIPCSLTSTPV